MSCVKNTEWGDRVENAVCERWPAIQPVPDDAVEWHDCVATQRVTTGPGTRVPGLEICPRGTPIEVKAARHRVDDHSGRRRGRWWIQRRNHEQLLEARGEYALGVYDPSQERAVRTVALLTAATVDRQIDTWTDCGRRHHAEQAARIPWTAVFNPDAVNGGDRA